MYTPQGFCAFEIDRLGVYRVFQNDSSTCVNRQAHHLNRPYLCHGEPFD
jgi:hypothetical protein